MSAAWLTYPLTLTGGREFECGDFTTEQCDYYMQRWHFWLVMVIFSSSDTIYSRLLGTLRIMSLLCQP